MLYAVDVIVVAADLERAIAEGRFDKQERIPSSALQEECHVKHFHNNVTTTKAIHKLR